MERIMTFPQKIVTALTLTSLSLSSFAAPLSTDEIAISAYIGGRYSDDLTDRTTTQEADFDDSFSQALALSWYYEKDAEGELLYSRANQTIRINDFATSLNISYLQFGGKLIFANNTPFSTSFGVGIGATFFIPDDSQYENEIAFSGNMNIGARYQLNPQWALKTDLRIYGTVMDSNSELLCTDNRCLIDVDGELYLQTELQAGIEYRF